jgi:hypothetical protein
MSSCQSPIKRFNRNLSPRGQQAVGDVFLPYILNVKDNWYHHEGAGSDLGSYNTAEAVISAARGIIDQSLDHIWKTMPREQPNLATAKALYDRWTWSGDNTYILTGNGTQPISPRFDPYEYAHAQAERVARAGIA